MTPDTPAAFLRHLLDTAIARAQPAHCLPGVLAQIPPPRGRTVVVGAGKAAAAMAAALEAHWPHPLSGLVVTRYGHAVPTRCVRVLEAAHPVPDAAGERAAREMLAQVRGLGADDLVICLLSGGGSALLALPAPGVTLDDKRALARQLLASGASIEQINTVRKHLSAIKGGRLAAACAPARVLTLAISDVPGDDPAVIASGPTVADPGTLADARAVLAQYGIAPPPAVAAALLDPGNETPKPGDARLSHADLRLVATPAQALAAAADAARAAGVHVAYLGDDVEGEARQVAAQHAALLRQMAAGPRPALLLSGGETTVTLRGRGRGGRNSEYLLALTWELAGMDGAWALAADTDGVDGSEDNAGAIMTPTTLSRAAALGLDARQRLDDNDGYGFFAALGDLVVTGPTLTNVNDFRALLLR